MSLRLFAGGLATETNVFSPMPTGLHDFVAAGTQGSPAFQSYIDLANACGYNYIQGWYGFAQPAGITPRATYEVLRDGLLEQIKESLPLDGILLNLHGAMVSDGYPDCESDLVQRVRTTVGDKAKIGVLLDLHCDIGEDLIHAADVIVTYKEYPHTDIADRATELGKLTVAAALGEIDPVMALFDCRMLGLYLTSVEPMRSYVDRMIAAERREGVLSVSLGHSFPWGDSADMGARVIVVADGDRHLAESVAEEFGRDFFALRHDVSLQPVEMRDALDSALALHKVDAPIVIADMADNAGGGAPSDSTFVLRELLTRNARNVAIGSFWDPIAVQQAANAGLNAKINIRLGGKLGPMSGAPLDLQATVRGLLPDLVQRRPQINGYIDISCGAAAWLEVDGIDVIVQSIRSQVFGLEVFTAFGIDLGQRHVVIVKSFNHFRAAYEPIASRVIYMSAPGALSFDFTSIPFEHVDTNKYPWIDNPWTDQ